MIYYAGSMCQIFMNWRFLKLNAYWVGSHGIDVDFFGQDEI
jgi:hypothetical protein